MSIELYAFIVTTFSWSALELLLFLKSIRMDRKMEKGSGWVLLITISAGIFFANVFAVSPTLSLPGNPDAKLLVGTIIMWIGILIRIWAITTLGKFFTTVITVHKDQKIITKGPYSIVRHPSYTGGFVTIFGLGVALGNILGLAIMMILVFFAYKYRMDVEESMMVSSFEDYKKYMKKTKRLIPFVY